MQKLEGFQSRTPSTFAPGVTVSHSAETYNLLDFQESDVNLLNIAKSLSRINRYLGHTEKPYSVAQHCVRGAEALMLCGYVKDAFAFLFHDASEAYTGDQSAPLKRLLAATLGPIEYAIEQAIARKFGYEFPYSDRVHQMDKNLAQAEMSLLMENSSRYHADYWTAEEAQARFLQCYAELQQMLGWQEEELKEVPRQYTVR